MWQILYPNKQKNVDFILRGSTSKGIKSSDLAIDSAHCANDALEWNYLHSIKVCNNSTKDKIKHCLKNDIDNHNNILLFFNDEIIALDSLYFRWYNDL